MKFAMNHTKKRVIIIGAGASGLAAATRLYENGIHDLLVLEAENRIGGRINTLNLDSATERIETGAQWIHGEVKNVVYKLALENNLYFRSNIVTNDKLLYARSNGEIISKEISDKLDSIANAVFKEINLHELLQYENCGSFYSVKLKEEFEKEENEDIPQYLYEEFIEYCHQYLNSYDASDTWYDSAVSSITEYKECEGWHFGMWKEGYQTLFSVLMEKSQEICGGNFLQQNVITNTKVKKISLDSDLVLIQCSDGRMFVADYVIVTVSLGVLKEMYKELLGSLPLCKENIQAIQTLKIGTVDKIFLKFPHQWWPYDVNGLSLLWTPCEREYYIEQGLGWVTDLFAFSRVDQAPLVLCGWISGKSAQCMEQLDEKEVQTTLIQILKHFFSAYFEIPDPVACIRSTWWSNEHFRGSYSYRSPEVDKLGIFGSQLCTPVMNQNGLPVVLFAGEATHKNFFSTVHGAVESGWREADRIILLMK